MFNLMHTKHFSKKALSEIISVVLVTLITTALIGTVYIWGAPLISKRQDTRKTDRVYNTFNEENSNSLVYKIQYVAKNGGRETFFSDTDGVWTLHEHSETGNQNNSIEFETFSKVTNVAVADPTEGIEWAPLTMGGSCPPQEGFVGEDSPFVVCAIAEPVTDGFTINYRLWSRSLSDTSGDKGYKINLVKDPNSDASSSGKSVSVSRKRVYTCTPPGTANECPEKKLIITEIEILLV